MILSFVLAAVACAFSALSYAELASSIPVSGSAYTYTYATLGEIVAWIIGWDLILEYGVSVAAVAVGWGGNLNAFLDAAFGVALPDAISSVSVRGRRRLQPARRAHRACDHLAAGPRREGERAGQPGHGRHQAGGAGVLHRRGRSSFSTDNFTPFAPARVGGVVTAAAIIFFAYIGFDAVSTGSEEAKNPSADLPLAIIGSLVICTIFYMLAALGAIGIAPAEQLRCSDAPLADGAGRGRRHRAGRRPSSRSGAVVAITSVMLVILYGQTRIFFAMCRDGLLPERLADVTPAVRHTGQADHRPRRADRDPRALVPLSQIVKLVNIGTLFAFVLVNVGVIVLRRTRPEMPRPYKVPLSSGAAHSGIVLSPST